jgi:hypothetical protein
MSASVAEGIVVRIGGDAPPVLSAEAHADASADPAVAATREQLGIGRWHGAATGHQPIFWHGGILAKALCASALSRDSGQGWLHLIADHDAVDPSAMPYPARRDQDSIRRATAHFDVPAAVGVAASAIDAGSVRARDLACPSPPASSAVAARLDAVSAAMAKADASRGAAWRTAAANFAVLSGAGVLEQPSHVICASSLLGTALGRDCVERIAADPESCARAFNDALALAPRAASRLRIDADASEVPLWEVGAGGVRTRIDGRRLRSLLRDGALDIGSGSGEQVTHGTGVAGSRPCVLLPRAFLATGIVRALGIHFVHGTGGQEYERAGDAWWRDALGRTLPPFSVATADLRFTAESFGLQPDSGVGALTWREAWVDPMRLDGVPRDPELERAAAEIAAMPRRSPQRRQAFVAMRTRVHAMRIERSEELDALASADAASRCNRASIAAATDRTYPAALHDAEALAGLAALVAGAVSASASASGASGSRR